MKSKTKRALLGLGVTATVVSPVATVVACGEENTDSENANSEITTTLNLTETEIQALVSFTGANGSGTVKINDLGMVGYTITYDEGVDGTLSNGDVVTFTVTAEAGYELGTTPEVFTVDVFGLNEVVNITEAELQALVSFTGTNGSGTVEIDDSDMVGYTITYGEGVDGTLSNGDVVTFTVTAEAGYELGTTPEVFTVDVFGLNEVVNITETELQALVSFTGANGSGTVEIDDSDMVGYTITYGEGVDGTLSNGDVVTFTVTAEAGYELGTTPEVFTVDVFGLNEVINITETELQALVSFTGANGSGTVEIDDSGMVGYTITYGEGVDGILSNDETVEFTVTATEGYVLGDDTPATFEVTVSGLVTLSTEEENLVNDLQQQIVNQSSYGTFVDEEKVLLVIQGYIGTVTEKDLLFASNDATGTLTITILDYFGEENDWIITLSGFKQYVIETKVDDWAYKEKILPEWFTVPETVTTIGDYAFYYATFLGNFTLANTQVVTIGNSAFWYVKLPAGFALPNSVTTIGNYAFQGATLPDGFKIPDNANIGTNAFIYVTMAGDLTWFDENGEEQTPSSVPDAGWYIAPKS